MPLPARTHRLNCKFICAPGALPVACGPNREAAMNKTLPALFLGAALLAGTADAGVMNPVPGDPVTIDSGKLSGTLMDGGIKAYLGVPFAQPPVRDLRWHAPMPVKPWA